MLHEIKATPSEAPIFAVINRKSAIPDHRAQGGAETIDVEAIRRNCLPRKVAAGAKAADVTYNAYQGLTVELSSDISVSPADVAD